jgi:hypothetical protein
LPSPFENIAETLDSSLKVQVIIYNVAYYAEDCKPRAKQYACPDSALRSGNKMLFLAKSEKIYGNNFLYLEAFICQKGLNFRGMVL